MVYSRSTQRIFLSLLTLTICCLGTAQQVQYRMPEGTAPEEVGKRVAEHFLQAPHGDYDALGVQRHVPYFEVCTWYGALNFADANGDTELAHRLVERFAPLMGKDSALLPEPRHVDLTVFGALPFELYMQTGDTAYLALGKSYADAQWAEPDDPEIDSLSRVYFDKGLTWQTRLWIDDMYMIPLVQAQAYRATGDEKYIDRAAREMVFYLDTLQQVNGLFHHAAGSPFFWGRGNGWVAAGMTELLMALPETHPDRQAIMRGYLKMMRSLLQYQTANGMWRQLLDNVESWEESSSTGMFTFAMVTGIREGWLDPAKYGTAAHNGWLALVRHINDNGAVTDVCEGTGAGDNVKYYLDRQRNTGDFHGQAPVLWCAAALLR